MKKTKTRLLATLIAALPWGAAGMLTSGEAQAQEIQLTGPLAGAPAVRKLRLYREGRFEVALGPSFTLLDEYRRTIFLSGRLQYNFTDWIGVGVWGGYGLISTTTDLTDQIEGEALRNSRTAANVNHTGTAPPYGKAGASFQAQTAKLQWVAAPQLTFTPFRGKFAIFQKIFVDTDLYLHGGLAFVGLQERGDCGGSGGQVACTNPTSFALSTRTAIAPTFGLGLTFYTGELVSLGVEYRALPFSWNRAGFDSRGAGSNSKFPDNKVDSQDQTFKFNQMITVAVGFSLPTRAKISD